MAAVFKGVPERKVGEVSMMATRLAFGFCIVALVLFLHVNSTEAVVITFTENGWTTFTPPRQENLPPPLPSDAFPGIEVSNAYQYGDILDPAADDIGIAPEYGTAGVIVFDIPTNAVTVDWWRNSSDLIMYPELCIWLEAYDGTDTLLDSFSSSGRGFDSGSSTLEGPMISKILFYEDNNGYEYPAISTLSFEPIPEPATMLILGGLGAGLVGARKLRRRK